MLAKTLRLLHTFPGQDYFESFFQVKILRLGCCHLRNCLQQPFCEHLQIGILAEKQGCSVFRRFLRKIFSPRSVKWQLWLTAFSRDFSNIAWSNFCYCETLYFSSEYKKILKVGYIVTAINTNTKGKININRTLKSYYNNQNSQATIKRCFRNGLSESICNIQRDTSAMKFSFCSGCFYVGTNILEKPISWFSFQIN